MHDINIETTAGIHPIIEIDGVLIDGVVSYTLTHKKRLYASPRHLYDSKVSET